MRTGFAAVCLLACVGCGAGPTTPTTPTVSPSPLPSPAPSPQLPVAAVEGVVHHEYIPDYSPTPAGPLAGAIVTVTEGPNAGATSTTDAKGTYRFQVAPGSFRLRWTATSYETADSERMTAAADGMTTVPTVTLRRAPIPPWTISGTVVDDAGHPVAGAKLIVSLAGVTFASAQSGADGHYVLTSTLQHPTPLAMLSRTAGYENLNTSPSCTGSCTATVNFQLHRILKEYLDVPTSANVGEVFAVNDVREHRNGVSRLRPNALKSSDPSVLEIQTTDPTRIFVKARSVGTATLRMPACDSPDACLAFTAILTSVSAVVRVYP